MRGAIFPFEGCYLDARELRAIQNGWLSQETAYRRIVYQLAIGRLNAVADMIDSAERDMTGKAYSEEDPSGYHTRATKRGKGVMPSIKAVFPELTGWKDGPARLLKIITKPVKPSDEWFALLRGAIEATEEEQGDEIQKFVVRSPQTVLRNVAPVVFPPHTGNARCKTCRGGHSEDLHRFHTAGAFARTHPTPLKQRQRAAERKTLANDDMPSWVTEHDCDDCGDM